MTEKIRLACVNLDSPFLINPKIFPPLGILYMSSCFKALGAEVSFYDFAGDSGLLPLDIQEDIVCITLTSPQIPVMKEFVNKLVNKKVILGGCGVESLSSNDPFLEKIQMIVKGEGELLADRVLAFANSKSDKTIVLQSDALVDVNTIPLPARDFVKDYHYDIDGLPTTTMITSRGCPFSCIFCRDAKKTLRMTKTERVLEEIDQVYNQGFKAIMFFDDVFTLQKKRLAYIGKYLSCRRMPYRAFTHVNFVDVEMCEILRDTGCKEIGVGIESGSDRILNISGKKFNRKKSMEAVATLKREGLRVKTFLMLGLPGENHETIAETKSWVEKMRPHDLDVSIFSPFPGTTLWNNKEHYDINWNGDGSNAYKGKPGQYATHISTSSLTSEDLIKYRDELEATYKPKSI